MKMSAENHQFISEIESLKIPYSIKRKFVGNQGYIDNLLKNDYRFCKFKIKGTSNTYFNKQWSFYHFLLYPIEKRKRNKFLTIAD